MQTSEQESSPSFSKTPKFSTFKDDFLSQSDMALAEGNVSAQQLVDILPTGIVISNDQDEIVFANRRFHELVPGCTKSFFSCWSQSILETDLDQAIRRYHEARRTEGTFRIEYRTRGELCLWCVAALTLLDGADSKVFGMNKSGLLCTITDITSEKNAELSQTRIAREAQERKEQQERFVDMISHEIRNPLSAILHSTEDIVEALGDSRLDEYSVSMITEAADTIGLCCAHQKKLVDDVLFFSKLDSSMLTLSPRRVQPNQHLSASMNIFRPELRRQTIEFKYQLENSYEECGIGWVMADLDRMSQVLINILSNAIKFTAQSTDEKSILISMGASIRRPPSYPPDVVFFETNEAALRQDMTVTPEWGEGQAAYIMVSVKDTGVGIPEHAQKRLFERFNQATPRTENVYGGSGLGLSISRRLCHLHGGEIGASSKDGEGSTFGFFFRVRRAIEASQSVSSIFDTEVERLCDDVQELRSDMTGDNELAPDPQISDAPFMPHAAAADSNAASAEGECSTNTALFLPSSSPKHECEPRDHIRNMACNCRPEHSKYFQQICPGSHARERKHVLVVEDNVLNRRILTRKLKTMGFETSEASNGQVALDKVEVQSFHCVLMDKEMPILDGNSATRIIREREKLSKTHLPVLGVTANAREEQKTQMMAAGMDDVIHKPYPTHELLERINFLVPQEPP